MRRIEEYQTLLTELEDTPPALEYTVHRAMARAKKRRRTRRFLTIGQPRRTQRRAPPFYH